MKRILIGVMALVSMGGLGVGGAYFVRQAMSASSAQPADEAEGGDEGPRDLTPTPIPIAPSREGQPAGGDPFANGARVAQHEMPGDDRNASRGSDQQADLEIPDADQVGVERGDTGEQ